MILDIAFPGSNKPNLVDTENASREELAKACVTLHRWSSYTTTLLEQEETAIEACGLILDETARNPLAIADDGLAHAWWRSARRSEGTPGKAGWGI
jgi:hypothetical protein